MENLKIHVNSEAESKEVQGLLEKLGFKKYVWGTYSDYFIFANSNYYSRDDISNFSECDYKEITLPELRDLVVLKRNDAGDATHYTEECGAKGFLTSDGIEYFWCYALKQWNKHKHSNFMEYQMKPIEKKEMKEYLDKQQDGTYKLIKADGGCIDRDWIEIPEGAEKATLCNGYLIFWKNEVESFSEKDGDESWASGGDNMSFSEYMATHDDISIVWRRHTHPEELPFIDDEPSQSLNDQYAEIETVRQTLNQRQEQYGSFEDVAQTTEQLFQVIKGGASFVDFTESQRMALYMIFSKVARLSNGNPNHKDSWHDIAGYATLIDNELVSEKDMPF